MAQLLINTGFIYEELTEGAAGLDLTQKQLDALDDLSNTVLEGILTEILEDDTHPFQAGLDALVQTAKSKILTTIDTPTTTS